MESPWGFARRCCFVAAALSFSGCASLPDSFETTPFLREQITGDTWRACLAREYQAQARSEVRFGRHWAQATRLSAKGRAALVGNEVAPDPPPSADLEAASARLAQALQRRAESPCACAEAQARYDGWVAKAGRGTATSDASASFDQAVAACTASR